MRSVFFILLVTLSLLTDEADGQTVAIIKFDELQRMVSRPTDTLYVVNFWATWCAPCVKELPQFEAVRQTYSTSKVKVLLVSMDDKADLKLRVIPFVRNRKIRSQVVLLDEPDLNAWVDKLAPEWSGALPMTLVINSREKRRLFIGKPVKDGELESIINHYKP